MKSPHVFAIRGLFCIAAALGLSACAHGPSTADALTQTLSPYRPDVLQGNVITREQVQALQVGMDRNQVAQILGTPLLQSVFHDQRWDYYFSFQRQGEPVQHRRLTLTFEGPRLARFEGDEMPSETEFVQAIARPTATKALTDLQASQSDLARFAKQNTPAAVPTPATALPKDSYPPLQSGSGLLQ